MHRRTKIALVVTAMLSLTAVAGARGWFGHHKMDPERIASFVDDRFEDVMDRLDATDDQQARLKPLVDNLVDEGLGLMKTRGELKTTLLAEWNAEKPNAEAVHAAIDARIDEFRAMAHKAADSAIEAHEIFTPEQRKQIADRVSHAHR
ncbi:MAG: Spy/CpxP family protein refolding chaperone [Bradymonadia bacterium]